MHLQSLSHGHRGPALRLSSRDHGKKLQRSPSQTKEMRSRKAESRRILVPPHRRALHISPREKVHQPARQTGREAAEDDVGTPRAPAGEPGGQEGVSLRAVRGLHPAREEGVLIADELRADDGGDDRDDAQEFEREDDGKKDREGGDGDENASDLESGGHWGVVGER